MAWPLDTTGARQCRERRWAGKGSVNESAGDSWRGRIGLCLLPYGRQRQSKTGMHGLHAQVETHAHATSPIQESSALTSWQSLGAG